MALLNKAYQIITEIRDELERKNASEVDTNGKFDKP
jgi:hypothetical protein